MTADRPSPAVWQDGVLRSALYGDIYFSAEDGLAETRAVFLNGCGLPGAWRGRRQFTVAELGFGTGLNIAALLDLWSREDSGGHLHIFSVEAHPMRREDAAGALAHWPELAPVASALLERWPGVRRGFHRIDLPAFRATLDVAVMDAVQALDQWRGKADAWFLDGFSPASNPAMWSEEVLGKVAERSAAGARLGTFTVAGAVRRGLEAAGFSVERLPGHGRKKHRLEARFPGSPRAENPPAKVAILGAGIAGASLARAFRALGIEPTVFDPGRGDGASQNPAALVTPGIDASGGGRAGLHAAAFARAVQLYSDLPEAVIARGALKLETHARDARRFAAAAAQDLHEPGALAPRSPAESAAWLDEDRAPGGLLVSEGLVVEPAKILIAWLGRVFGSFIQNPGDLEGFDAVVVAGGWGASALLPKLALKPIRGQASWASLARPPRAASFGGYAIPTREGVLFGATFDRGDLDTVVRTEDHQRNLDLIKDARPRLAARIDLEDVAGRAAIRATTPDQLPLAGQVGPGLYVLAGLGSRGFTTAPLLAEHVAALACETPSPLPADLARLVEPTRF